MTPTEGQQLTVNQLTSSALREYSFAQVGNLRASDLVVERIKIADGVYCWTIRGKCLWIERGGTFIASDLHIGRTHNLAAWVFFQVAKKEARRIILLGDVLDLWFAQWDEIKSNIAYLELIDTVKKVPTTIVRGNHDFYLTKWQVPGAQIVDEFEEEDMYSIHGWQYDPIQVLLRPLFHIITRFLPLLSRHLGQDRENTNPARNIIFEKLYFILGTLLIPLFPFILSCVPQIYRLLGIKPFYKCWRKSYIYLHPDIFKLAILNKMKNLDNKPIPLYKRISFAAGTVQQAWLRRLEIWEKLKPTLKELKDSVKNPKELDRIKDYLNNPEALKRILKRIRIVEADGEYWVEWEDR
jgi:hypothetical protein